MLHRTRYKLTKNLAKSFELTAKSYSANGYTIFEVMMFLAVSSVLLVSALALVGGQQNKTQFYQSVNELRSQLEDIINDNVTGFYPVTADFSCSANNASRNPPTITPGGSEGQGENLTCTYLGRYVKFGENSNSRFRVYTLVGRQFFGAPGTSIVKDHHEASPVAIYFSSNPDGTVVEELENGLTIRSISYNGGSLTGGVGFFSNLDQPTGGSSTVSTRIMVLNNGNLADDVPNTVAKIRNSPSSTVDRANYAFPDSAELCFNSGTTRQNAVLTIGSDQGRLSIDVAYNSGDCSP